MKLQSIMGNQEGPINARKLTWQQRRGQSMREISNDEGGDDSSDK